MRRESVASVLAAAGTRWVVRIELLLLLIYYVHEVSVVII
jgi:hypothetical protein